MTRLLVDENYPRSAAAGLQAAGHDVCAVAAVAAGANDRAVLALARAEGRCLVTFDSDFGDLVFHHGEAPPPAIVLLRLHPIVSDEVLALTEAALQSLAGREFVVATAEGLRRRPLPAARGDGST